MTPTTALERLAFWAATVLGLRSAEYPAPLTLAGTPFLGVLWDETTITHGNGMQYWEITARGQLVVARMGNVEREVTEADPLITPIVDRFRAKRNNPAYHLQPTAGSPDMVDLCEVIRIRPSVRFSYGSAEPNSYGAEIFWRIKLRRTPAETP